MIKEKRIIAGSIKYNLISQVSSRRTPKEMFDALSNLFEMNECEKSTQRCEGSEVRNHALILNKSILDQGQLESMGEMIEDAEVVMTTLNGLPRDWEFLIRGICFRKKLTKFRQLWEECVQEEERIAVREEKLYESEDQALAVHTKGKNKRKIHGHLHRKSQGFKKSKKDF